jgi:gamma-glutamyl:cysteine ligase YbdK (ATP-grasp superfamily)
MYCRSTCQSGWNTKIDLEPLIDDLIEFCSPIAADINETQGLGMARDLLKSRPGYQRQLDAHADEGTARSVAAMLQASMLGQSEYLYQ